MIQYVTGFIICPQGKIITLSKEPILEKIPFPKGGDFFNEFTKVFKERTGVEVVSAFKHCEDEGTICLQISDYKGLENLMEGYSHNIHDMVEEDYTNHSLELLRSKMK